jgi:DUF1680 family protein
VADFPNQIYYKDASSLYVSLYLPSEVTWNGPGGEVKVKQDSKYPEGETINFTVDAKSESPFSIKFRVPGWSKDMSVKVNGEAAKVDCKPGAWAVLQRAWKSGDKVEVNIPLKLRYEAVDKEHPQRIAIVRGPAVIVQAGNAHEPIFKLPENEEDLNKQLVADDRRSGYYNYRHPSGTRVQGQFFPFYEAIESLAYRMYWDNDQLPFGLWGPIPK